MSHLVRIASILLLLAAPAAAQTPAPLPPRVGFEGGAGLYGGEINCENENGEFCDGVTEAGGFDLHANYFVNPKLGITLDIWPMFHTEDNWTFTHNIVTVGAKWRPVPILTLTAGVGSAQAKLSYRGIVNLDSQTEAVPSVMFAAALEVVRGRNFAIDVQARVGAGFYEEDENNNGEADIVGRNVGFGVAATWF
jgi:hypothetical protein